MPVTIRTDADNGNQMPELPENIQQRQEEVCCHPPRITADHGEATVAAARQQLAKIAGAGSGKAVDIDAIPIPEMLLTVMCHQPLFERVAEVSLQLLKEPCLPLRDRQLLILRTAWLRRVPYIWGEHVRVSKSVGLSAEDIEQVTVGPESAHWNDHERALLTAVEELGDSAMISDSTWSTLTERLNDKQMFELTVLVGQFTTVGYFQNALRIPLAPGNEGLAAR